MPSTSVHIIQVFEGFRHDRLRAIWRALSRDTSHWNLHWFRNDSGLNHAAAFRAILDQHWARPERYMVLTEHDCLPGPGFPGTYLLEEYRVPVLGVQYVTRDPRSMVLHKHSFPGGWFLLIDKEGVSPEQIDVSPGGPFNDPGNLLAKKLGKKMAIIGAEDRFPAHYGVKHQDVVEHLFWSRHYHDAPDLPLNGFCLRDIQRRVDRYTAQYILEMPESAKEHMLEYLAAIP